MNVNNKENETVCEKSDATIANIQVHKNTDDSIRGAANLKYNETETTSVKTDAPIENAQMEPKIVSMKKEEQAKFFTPPSKVSKPNATSLPRSCSKLLADNNVDMSPGSRYIAMARQGLLESQESPKIVSEARRSSQPSKFNHYFMYLLECLLIKQNNYRFNYEHTSD